MNNERTIMTRQEVADLLRVSTKTVAIYEKSGLPVHRPSPSLRRYVRAEVLNWLSQRGGNRGLCA